MITAAPAGISGGKTVLLCRLLAASRAQKTLDTDKVHIQRPETLRRIYHLPLYKKQNRRYNKNRNVPMIRLCMELRSPYAGGRCYQRLLLHCTFCALQDNYTAFYRIVKRKAAI